MKDISGPDPSETGKTIWTVTLSLFVPQFLLRVHCLFCGCTTTFCVGVFSFFSKFSQAAGMPKTSTTFHIRCTTSHVPRSRSHIPTKPLFGSSLIGTIVDKMEQIKADKLRNWSSLALPGQSSANQAANK